MFATFRPADDRTRAVLRRGEPVSSLARFTGTDTPPASLLMDACQKGDSIVRIELLVHAERTKQLPEGSNFELVAGDALLGNGTILPRAAGKETTDVKPPR